MLGSIASQYYLKYMTVSMFGSNIGPDTSLEVIKSIPNHNDLILLYYVHALFSLQIPFHIMHLCPRFSFTF